MCECYIESNANVKLSRHDPVTETINHQLYNFKSAARPLDFFSTAMKAGEAQRRDVWFFEIDSSKT